MEITFTNTDYYLTGILVLLFAGIILLVFQLIKSQRRKNEKLDHEYLLKISLGQFINFVQSTDSKELIGISEKLENTLSSNEIEEEDIEDLNELLKMVINDKNAVRVMEITVPAISKILSKYPRTLTSSRITNISAKFRAN